MKHYLGEKMSRWTVIGKTRRVGMSSAYIIPCRCSCGTEKYVHRGSLLSGHSGSCGCIKSEVTAARNFKHGMAGTQIYSTWMNMRQRCSNRKNEFYKDYGGRGIAVCKRWNNFENFLDDMGDRPSTKHTLDRINNDGNYNKSNCRWVSGREQYLNRRSTRKFTFNGVEHFVVDVKESFGVGYSAFRMRYYYRGWTLEEALGIKEKTK